MLIDLLINVGVVVFFVIFVRMIKRRDALIDELLDDADDHVAMLHTTRVKLADATTLIERLSHENTTLTRDIIRLKGGTDTLRDELRHVHFSVN